MSTIDKSKFVRISIRGKKWGDLRGKFYVHPQIAAQIIALIAPHIDNNTGYATTNRHELEAPHPETEASL